jgi:hypothetical protein
MLAQMAFQHFGHQAIDRTAYRSNLLQYRHALLPFLQRPLDGGRLALDTPYSGQ